MVQPASKRLLTEANAAAQASDSATPFGAALSATILDQIETTSADPAGPIQGAIATAIEDAGVGAPAPRTLVSAETPNELLARTADFATGSLRIAVASDSTWNDANDMIHKFAIRMGQITPANFGVKHKMFDTATQLYKAWTEVKAGGETPATGGVVLTDNFNRTASELVGSTTSGGQVWAGTTGTWTADGTQAHAAGASSVPLSFNAGTPDTTATATYNVVTATGGTAPVTRLYVGGATATVSTANGVFAELTISTTGIPSFKVWKRIGGTSTQIVTTDTTTGLTNNSASVQTAVVSIALSVQNVTATLTVNGGATETYNATITESDYAALGGYSGLTMAVNTGDYVRLDNITMETPYTPGSFNGLEVWNGAVAGSNLPYQQTRMELLYPAATPFDILIVSGGHNKGTTSAADFITEVDAFIDAFKAAHPETLILVSSQNPQFAPAPYVAAHAARQAAWRAYAMENGYEYLPVFEAFAAQSDGGASLVQSDGIHPTYPGMPNATAGIWNLDWSGSVLWAAVWMEAINARRVTSQAPLTAIP